MSEQKLDINELIKVEAMPKIFYQLEAIGSEIDNKLSDLKDMECTEENKDIVKKRRTEINNLNKIMEEKRKQIKNEILKDYNVFEEKYEEEIKSKLVYASAMLKEKIDDIENGQKLEKENKLREFANQYIENYNLGGIVDYEKLNINVTLSASEKSLKTAIKSQLEEIANYVKLILQEEYSDEIMVEYKKSLDYVKAKMEVIERHHQIEQLKIKEQEQQDKQIQEEKNIETVEEIIAPVEVEEKIEEIQEVSFTVWACREDIIKIRDFIRELGVKYE